MKKLFVAVALLSAILSGAFAQTRFEFIYEPEEQYRVISTVEQDVWVNGLYRNHATILNRIAVEVADVADGSGFHEATFVTSEEATSGDEVFSWGEEYYSEFWRDRLGRYDIGDQYFMPVVRDVPVFPDRPLEPGDTWSSQGSEVHDFRRSFGIPDAFHFPIPVTYSYLENTERDGRDFAVIEISYNVFYRPTVRYPGAVYPVRITGWSRQTLYWDLRAGRPHEYEESYEFDFALSSGEEVVYAGTAEARIVEASRMDRTQVMDEIRSELDRRGFEDQEVVEDERGVTIRLDNIQFPPDSAYLWDSEKEKLRSIAEILANYPERDILITGHTALAGTEAGRLQLSRDRAAAVASYLIEIGARQRDQVILRGVGATEPVADNLTEEGMRRNRRVEITILEN
jgi:outer membrane protein OmpA-like peptidoglycan-associated protein